MPGNEYIIYLRYGGVARLNLAEKDQSSRFKYYWYDPATGECKDPSVINGAEQLEFKCPEKKTSSGTEIKDWVLHIQKEN